MNGLVYGVKKYAEFTIIRLSQFPRAHGDVFGWLFQSHHSPKLKDCSFTIPNDKEKQPILTLQKLERANVLHFLLEKCLKQQ